jgi:hypothetical protein
MPSPTPHLAEAFRLFDAANSEDPNREPNEVGELVPKEVLYAQRMSACLARVAPDAPEAVQLAARCQQKIPRRAGWPTHGPSRLRARHDNPRTRASAEATPQRRP